jgi:lon-related putative ATP-dependent protease
MELTPDQLRRRAAPETFGYRTTAELEPAAGQLGQRRAESAIEFAMSMRFEGYNLYALGAPQVGMLDFVREHLLEFAREQEAPPDWLYLNDFADPPTPRICQLPRGLGRRFKGDMAHFLSAVRSTVPDALSSEDFRRRTQELAQSFQQKQQEDATELQQEAERLGLTMLPTPNGFAFAPVQDGKVMEHEAFVALPEERRNELTTAIEQMNQRLIDRLQDYPQFQHELIRKQRELATETTNRVLGGLAARMFARYQTYPDVVRYVVEARAHLLENVERILMLAQGQAGQLQQVPAAQASAVADQFYKQYEVNLIVDNADLEGAPVVYESNPSLDNLVGKLEHRFEYGTPVTDSSMIRAGALHRANGGYLIVDLARLVQKPFAWEALKRALADKLVRIESVSQMMSMAYTVSMDPAPMPLSVKVVLLGDRMLYHLLRDHDPDFDTLFKILADFDDYVAWDAEHEPEYAAMLARLVRDSKIRHLTADAVARTLEHSARLTEDRRRLTARVIDVGDILREADQLAAQEGAGEIHARHIDSVVMGRAYRVDRIRELVHENITRGVTVVETRGSKVGQINGLSVMHIGKLVFGQPSRITATARIGRGELIDIEREARLGGNIHTKAVMIVANFIGARYAREQPLSLHASLVFEQSYGGIEGDSASIAEVCALISAIIERPLRQDLALTGSMDQHGTVQAIGGVNQKIEGFFDICNVQGLTGTQGVLIPRSNLDNLMLRQDVVDAVTGKRFHVYDMGTVDDAFAILFAGPDGVPIDPSTIDDAVCKRLQALHDLHRDGARERPSVAP